MAALQKEFDRIFEELCTNESLRVMLMRHVAEARGLSLTDEQVQTLAKAINDESREDEVKIELEGFSEDIEITSEDLEAALKKFEKDMGSARRRQFSRPSMNFHPAFSNRSMTIFPRHFSIGANSNPCSAKGSLGAGRRVLIALKC